MIAGGPVAQLAGDPLVTGGSYTRVKHLDGNYTVYSINETHFLKGIFDHIFKDSVNEYFDSSPVVPNILSNPSAVYYFTPDSIDPLKDPSADAPLDRVTNTISVYDLENSRFGEPFFRSSNISADKKFPTPRLNGY